MPTNEPDHREREAWGFATGTALMCIATLVIGSWLPPIGAVRVDFIAVIFAALSGTPYGYLWWWHQAGDLPMSVPRALFLCGTVSLSILFFMPAAVAVIAAMNHNVGWRDQIWNGFVTGLMGCLVALQKFALPLLALMVLWTLLWRFVVNRRHAARSTA